MQRVALIGAGYMGSVHASCYPEMHNARLVAVMDVRPDAAAEVAARYGAEAYSDAEKMFKEADFDVVDICTPTLRHIDYIRMAAAAGKHVCCEKPFGRTIEECKEATSLCNKAGVTLFVAHVLRWYPEFRKAKELIGSGSIGEPAVVRTSRISGPPRGWNDWFLNYEWSGGVVMDMIIHDFDWLLWTFGPASRVFATGLMESGIENKDYALVTIRFKNGVIAHVEGSWATPTGFSVSFEVAGDKGLMDFDSSKMVSLVSAHWGQEPEAAAVPTPGSPIAASPYLLEMQHFIDCLETGTQPAVTPKEATNAVTLALAAIESIKTGVPVKL